MWCKCAFQDCFNIILSSHHVILRCCRIEGTAVALTAGPSTPALQGSAQPHSAHATQRAACRATSAVEPLRAVSDEAEGSPHHRPPTPFWQATLMAATSAPRPDLASTLQQTSRVLPQAMSDVLPGSKSSSDKEEPLDQDEKHLRHHVQTWLDAAVAVSGAGLLSHRLIDRFLCCPFKKILAP